MVPTTVRAGLAFAAFVALAACGSTAGDSEEWPGDEQTYLEHVSGVAGNAGSGDLLAAGYFPCQQYSNGSDVVEVATLAAERGMNSADALIVATAAGAHLCPEELR